MNHSNARPPCPSQTPRVYSNSCPLIRWFIQPSHPMSSPSPPAPQSLPASGSFQMSQLFASGGQSIGVSASASVLPMNTQDLSPSGWTDWISLQSKGLSWVFSNTTVQKRQFFGVQLSLWFNPHIHWIDDASQPSHPLLSPSPPAFNLSQYQGLFQWVSSFYQVAKSIGALTSASVLPMNTFRISFRMDWLDLLAVQGTLMSLLQHHSSKASILQCLAFFIVQLSHPYMTTGKTIALTRQTFVDKVMSVF